MLSNGTPMLRAGDELLQSQQGNSNAWDQDNEISWLDWRKRDEHPGFWRFVQQMIAFRKAHPSLARSRFWRDDVRWFGPHGVPDLAQPIIAMFLRGSTHDDRDLYVMVNGGASAVTFVIQDVGDDWHLAIDTSRPSPDDIELAHPAPLAHPSYNVAAHAVVVLVRGA